MQTKSRLHKVSMASSEAEREAIYRFRYAVYVEEMGKKPGYADHQRKMLQDTLDETAALLYLAEEDRVIGTIRLNFAQQDPSDPHLAEVCALSRFVAFPPQALSFTSRLMVAPEWRGSFALASLVAASYDLAIARGARFNFCHCMPSLVHLYEQLGYRRYTANFEDPDVGYQVPMVLLLQDAEWLRRVRSPMLAIVGVQHDPEVGPWFNNEFPAHAAFVNERVMGTEEFWSFLTERLHREDIPMLQGLDEKEARQFLRAVPVLQCQVGDKVVRTGDIGKEMYVLLSGVVEVVARSEGRELSLATFGKGQVFGEMAFLSEMPRTADVVVRSPAEVLVLDQPMLHKALKTMPAIAARVLLNLSLVLCERLRMSTRSWMESAPRAQRETPHA